MADELEAKSLKALMAIDNNRKVGITRVSIKKTKENISANHTWL